MSGVKLFGKTIELPPETVVGAADQSCDAAEEIRNTNCSSDAEDQESLLIQSGPKQDNPNEESKDPNATLPPLVPEKLKEDPTELDKTTLKKPEKTIPCPRCNSIETKFCYFNNYNVNQPRHFCRNCQRYWTAGGTMRKVPVGAGRRKNKNILAAASQFCPLTVPMNHTNGTILAFNSETPAPLCESMVSVLNIVDKTVRSGEMDGDDRSSGSSYSSSKDEVPVFHGPSQPYPWQNPIVQWTSPISSPTFAPASIPLSYWGGPTIWNIPFVITPPAPSSGLNSSTLGKHSRDENIPTTQMQSGNNNNNPEKCLWVPKTLRIDESRDTAKSSSSILAALGIKSDIRVDDACAGVGGLFKALQSRSTGDESSPVQEKMTVLQANPAARSVAFRITNAPYGRGIFVIQKADRSFSVVKEKFRGGFCN